MNIFKWSVIFNIKNYLFFDSRQLSRKKGSAIFKGRQKDGFPFEHTELLFFDKDKTSKLDKKSLNFEDSFARNGMNLGQNLEKPNFEPFQTLHFLPNLNLEPIRSSNFLKDP